MNTDGRLANILLERPITFKIDGKRFYLYPPTLGKSVMLSDFLEETGVNVKRMQSAPSLEALRLVKEKRTDVCKFIALHTLRKRDEIFDTDLLNTRINTFSRNLKPEELASLFISCLIGFEQDVEGLKKDLGIKEEQRWFDKAVSAREDRNTLTFFGKSIYGTLISHACEKYGWSFDYVLWGISRANLEMLLSDEIRTVYLSDDELRRAHIPHDRNVLKAENMSAEQIRKALNL